MVDEKTIDRLEQKKDKQRVKIKRKTESKAAYGGVMDKYTQLNLNKLRNKGVFRDFIGIISAGKEANVYFAVNDNDQPIAIKIYKIDSQNTKWMKNYIIGDPRFNKIGTSTHKIIYTWCKKEYKNLKQMYRHNIPVPKPIDYKSNILAMEFIGENNGSPAKRLKDENYFLDIEKMAKNMFDYIKKMYLEAHLVHGDLSEFNILWYNQKQIIIDVSQALSTFHVNAPYFLERDVKNMINFYSSFIPLKNLPNIKDFVKEIIDSSLD